MPFIFRDLSFLRFVFPPPAQQLIYDLSNRVQLTHQVLSGTHFINSLRSGETAGAVDVLSVDSATVPDGFFWWIPYLELGTTDATARTPRIQVRLTKLPAAAIIHVAIKTPQDAGLSSSVYASTAHVILLPEGGVVRAQVNALTVGSAITLRFIYAELRPGEPVPVW